MSEKLLERILENYGKGDFESEIISARKEYFALMSDLRDDDPLFERLTQCFLYWFALDRPLDGDVHSPLQRFVKESELSEQEHGLCESMAASVRSLFEVLKFEEDGVTLRDLFNLEVVHVRERRHLAGLKKGDILETRLLPRPEMLVFAPGAFILHPRSAGKSIRMVVERSRLKGHPKVQDLIVKLEALTFRYVDRYRERVPVEKVFGELEEKQI